MIPFARWWKEPDARRSRRRTPIVEALEGRVVLSRTPAPVAIDTIQGLQFNVPGVIWNSSGRGIDQDIQDMAETAYHVAHMLNAKRRVIDVDLGQSWRSRPGRSRGGRS